MTRPSQDLTQHQPAYQNLKQSHPITSSITQPPYLSTFDHPWPPYCKLTWKKQRYSLLIIQSVTYLNLNCSKRNMIEFLKLHTAWPRGVLPSLEVCTEGSHQIFFLNNPLRLFDWHINCIIIFGAMQCRQERTSYIKLSCLENLHELTNSVGMYNNRSFCSWSRRG